MKNSNNLYLDSKPRYEILDGLRGVAAAIIVVFHLLETYATSPLTQHVNHGYLAVDFFFVLSGFVIGYAYDDRWSKMTLWGFFKRRLIRLHPMMMFGCVVGLVLFYFTGSGDNFPLVDTTPLWMLGLVFFWCLTIIPLPASMDIRGWAETNPLNGPVWTLQWEYLANILYALFIRKLPKWALAACVGCFGVMTLLLCMNVDWLGVLPDDSVTAYTVIGGWVLTPDHLLIGFTRLLYPFFMGLLLSRLGKTVNVRGGFWLCALLVAAALVMPRIGGTANMWMNGAYEALIILVLFPLVVAVGAGSHVTGRSMRVCKLLGEISYPLYVTHFPLVYLQKSWYYYHPDAPFSQHVFIGISVFCMAVFTAWAAYKLYDLPVRTWLRRKLFTARSE